MDTPKHSKVPTRAQGHSATRPIYGMPTDPSTDIVKEIGSARKMGFDFVELGMEPPEGNHNLLRKKSKAILSGLRRFDHPPVAHSAYWCDLWTSYDEVREAWIDVMKQNIRMAASLGCRKFNIHTAIPHGMYNHSAKHWKHAIGVYISSMKEIVRYASGKEMTIMMENMGPFGADFDEFSRIMSSVPGLKAHLDIGHAFLEGGMKMVRKYLRSFGKDVEHFHFTDNLGLSDDHIGIGQGIIDYYSVMELVKKIKYAKTISLEIFSSRKDLRDSLKIMRILQEEIWPG